MHHSILLRNNDVISISKISFIAKKLKNQILILECFCQANKLLREQFETECSLD